MQNELVTIASFDSQIEANLARDLLADHGVKACLSGENLTAMSWIYTNAVGGIKLLVSEHDATEASRLLPSRAKNSPNGNLEVLSRSQDSENTTNDSLSNGSGVEDSPMLLSPRDVFAKRAIRCALFGLIWLPIQYYAFWLFLKAFLSNGTIDSKLRRQAILVAICTTLPIMIGTCVVVRWILVSLR